MAVRPPIPDCTRPIRAGFESLRARSEALIRRSQIAAAGSVEGPAIYSEVRQLCHELRAEIDRLDETVMAEVWP